MTQQADRTLLQRRLRALLALAGLLVPTLCAFGTLAAVLASSNQAIFWVALTITLALAIALALVVARGVRTLAALNADEPPSSSNLS